MALRGLQFLKQPPPEGDVANCGSFKCAGSDQQTTRLRE